MKIEKLTPAFKDYVWGGNKLKEKYGKHTDLSPCAESWELSAHKDGLSMLPDGRTILEAFDKNDLGVRAARFDVFPMLIKFIDAASDLSVQVHPSDEYAAIHEKSLGKSELWYVAEANEGAGGIQGADSDVDFHIIGSNTVRCFPLRSNLQKLARGHGFCYTRIYLLRYDSLYDHIILLLLCNGRRRHKLRYRHRH